MGRGAGNAETELFIAINDETRSKVRGYDLNYFLEDINNLKKINGEVLLLMHLHLKMDIPKPK